MKEKADYQCCMAHLAGEAQPPHLRPHLGLPLNGYVRLAAIVQPDGPLPISRSTWWKGVSEGRYPRPIKLGPRITAWRVSDVIALIEQMGG
jgi:prophage regulatory protein